VRRSRAGDQGPPPKRQHHAARDRHLAARQEHGRPPLPGRRGAIWPATRPLSPGRRARNRGLPPSRSPEAIVPPTTRTFPESRGDAECVS
jgi:hypothetical protein